MPEVQQVITLAQVIGVLQRNVQPLTVDNILDVLLPNPIPPEARQEAMAIIRHQIQFALATGHVEEINHYNELYYRVQPLEEYMEGFSSPDNSDDEAMVELGSYAESEDSGYFD